MRVILYGESMGWKKKKTVETYESHTVQIIDWKVDYSLSIVKDSRIVEGPYWEHCSLDLKGEFLGSKKLGEREVRINLLADRSLDEAIAKPYLNTLNSLIGPVFGKISQVGQERIAPSTESQE